MKVWVEVRIPDGSGFVEEGPLRVDVTEGETAYDLCRGEGEK